MSKPRTKDLIRCKYFCWRIGRRNGVWSADGRSNPHDAGRHSLGTTDRAKAMDRLEQLDAVVAAELGLAPAPEPASEATPLPLEAGRRLYEDHIKRPRVAGGVRASTQKRYRAVFDKFIPYAKSNNVLTWNFVTTATLHSYASHLERKDYAGKTLRNELTTLVQTQKWLIQEKHLLGVEPLRLKMRKVESQPAYCYTPEQVQAMIQHCRANPKIGWLGGVMVGLACTGLRISELASLRWTDIDLAGGRLNLTDESARPVTDGRKRRELKSGRSRNLPIHPDLAAVLAETPKKDGYIFHGPRGGRLKPDTVRNVLIREVITPLTERFASTDGERGFKDGRVHSFRHFFCSMCANSRVPERVVMAWLGHQDSDMIRIYYHLHDQESRTQMQKLDPLGSAGKRLAGIVERVASTNESGEEPSQESSATTAT